VIDLNRANNLEQAGWSALIGGVEGLPHLECLCGNKTFRQLLRGEIKEISGNWMPKEILAAAAILLPRSALTLQKIEM
jgi:hypothetical protein